MMNLKEKSEDLRMQQAAEWLQLLREGQREAHAEFIEWISESPANLKAFLTMDALSHASRPVLKAMAPADRTILPAAPNVVELTALSGATKRDGSAHSSLAGRRHWAWGLTAAFGLVVLGVAWQVGRYLSWTSYTTGPAQQRTVALADGSEVHLNAQSKIAVRFKGRERSIRLTQGEALFAVAPDARHPFRVRTRDAVVEAVGTQFNVNARGDGTLVAVVEGQVRVSPDEVSGIGAAGKDAAASSVAAVASLTAGEAAQVTRKGDIQRRRNVDVKQAIAWSRLELVFRGTSLEEAVAQFNRSRRATPLRLVDVKPGSHHYTGIFSAADAESFAQLLALEKDLIVEKRDGEIWIRGRE